MQEVKKQTDKLEAKLADTMKAGPKLPDNGKKQLVQWMPWIALVFGVIQLAATWSLWRAGHRANEFLDSLNRAAESFGIDSAVPKLGLMYWVSLIALAVSAVILLLAYPGLKARKKAGWNWLFYGSLLNVAYGVLAVFIDDYYGGGFGRLVWAVVGTAISLWLLFQIRDHYKA